ncbi:leucine-rich repeat-containing protein 49 isoform X3 [Hydra vulgaris]|uniref:leucine-rich repeat-containing protein 49 isoform X3 n=1 Tax=Hydra vulgaris TaxID=6087 RepID=UPI0032EA594D
MANDGVIITELAALPGVPVAYRLFEAKKADPKKLDLSRRELTVCPLVKDGLSNLECLRVLILGRNRIKIISNLENLTSLDVLDLHGNMISKINNLNHLKKLRVLNLANNRITVVENLSGLEALTELNLNENCINTVIDLDLLPLLQKFYVNFNGIKRFNSFSCLQKCISLTELSINENIFSVGYQNVASLKKLDLMSITEKRRKAIKNAENEWIKMVTKKNKSDRSLDMKQSSISHLAELHENILCLYGNGSLKSLEKDWGTDTLLVISISFRFILFEEIRPFLSNLSTRFPSLNSLVFDCTNICNFNDINALSKLHKLDHLTISEKGNSVTNLTLWRDFVVFCLSNLNLKTLNSQQISEVELKRAFKIFGSLRNRHELNSFNHSRRKYSLPMFSKINTHTHMYMHTNIYTHTYIYTHICILDNSDFQFFLEKLIASTRVPLLDYKTIICKFSRFYLILIFFFLHIILYET